MTEGLITRIGKWLDRKWAKNAKETDIEALRLTIQAVSETCMRLLAEADHGKDVIELKTRLERLELYTGMMGKRDPAKAAELKSAFSM